VTISANGLVSNGSTFAITQPTAPVISGLSPFSAPAGGPAFTLTVSGSGFAANSTISWNGAALPTTFGNNSQLTGAVGANLIATPGAVTVTVNAKRFGI
jgi:hypothetical protein